MTQQLPDFIEWRARDLASRVNSQDLTAVQVTQAALARIVWANPLLNAFIDIDHASALKQATAVDLKIQQGARLPLAGVPFSVKDNLWVAGRPATYGSKLYADHLAAINGGVRPNVVNLAIDGETSNSFTHGAGRVPPAAGFTDASLAGMNSNYASNPQSPPVW